MIVLQAPEDVRVAPRGVVWSYIMWNTEPRGDRRGDRRTKHHNYIIISICRIVIFDRSLPMHSNWLAKIVLAEIMPLRPFVHSYRRIPIAVRHALQSNPALKSNVVLYCR